MCCCGGSSRQALLASQRGSDGDKLTPSHISSSRGPLSLDTRHHHQSSQHHHNNNMDDDDKLLDVVGPPQSPLLSLGQSIHQMHPHSHGEFIINIFKCCRSNNFLWLSPFCAGWFNFANEAHMEDVRRRLQGTDDKLDERDGSDSNCSDSVGGGSGAAFRPAGSPKESGVSSNTGPSYPSPNISVGPPIHPPPHLLPYLYPHGLYPPPPLSLLHNPAAAMNPGLNPGLFLNAQLALAAQHPALFGHYSAHSSTSPLHNLKSHRFSPYSLTAGLGSAFDAVTPGSNSGGPRSLSSSPPSSNHHLRAASNSPPPNRPLSVSPTPPAQTQTQRPHSQHSAFTPMVPSNNNNNTINNKSTTAKSSPNELKNMEKMINGLDVQHNGTTAVPATSLGSSNSSIRSTPEAGGADQIWHSPNDTNENLIVSNSIIWQTKVKNQKVFF